MPKAVLAVIAAGVLAVTAAAGSVNAIAAKVKPEAAITNTTFTIDGQKPGLTYDGIGAISGGGATARLLIDYPPAQRTQILNYLFGPGGADLQILKMEIGGDAAQNDGADPSIEHVQGQIDCQSGYQWWLAEQAVARNPDIILMGLQWDAPGWIGNVWNPKDITYIIDWLNCAKSHGLHIGYIGGWNEHGYNVAWTELLRNTLDLDGYNSVQIVMADSFPGPHYQPARTFQVAQTAASDPAFKAALGAIGVHDTCGHPTNGFKCFSTPTARHLGLPIWETELGSLKGDSAAADLARAINNGYIQADVSAFIEWPMTSAMSPGLIYSNRGYIAASQPQSGYFFTNRIAWVTAQTTQFVQPGWEHVIGASGTLGQSGTYVAYESPDETNWSLVAEDAGNQKYSHDVRPERITATITGGLSTGNISVWSTNLWSSKTANWFVHEQNVPVTNGTFSYTIQPGYLVTFTSTTGQSKLSYPTLPYSPQKLPFTATPDGSNEAWDLDTQEGAYLYEPCRGGDAGRCLQQMAPQTPIFWQIPPAGTPTPYAITGALSWANYTVSAQVLFTGATDSAGLIGRYSTQASDPRNFDGYQFDLFPSGHWRLKENTWDAGEKILASGNVKGITLNHWYKLSLNMSGSKIIGSVGNDHVVSLASSAYKAGLAGVESNYSVVQFNDLKVTSDGS
jgi:hypothetical protein